jgi:hypothetical protein
MIDALKEKAEALKALRDQARRECAIEVRDFLTAEPNGSSISWVQYVPFFNDGDECKFTTSFHLQGDDIPFIRTEERMDDFLRQEFLLTTIFGHNVSVKVHADGSYEIEHYNQS